MSNCILTRLDANEFGVYRQTFFNWARRMRNTSLVEKAGEYKGATLFIAPAFVAFLMARKENYAPGAAGPRQIEETLLGWWNGEDYDADIAEWIGLNSLDEGVRQDILDYCQAKVLAEAVAETL